MATVLTVDAVSHRMTGWHSIDWQKVHRNVRRLQARIVQAAKAGKWRKVKSLQRLLSRSFSAKAQAVKRVTENKGKRTPGVDGVIWNTPRKKAIAIRSLRQRGYRPQPLRRVYVPKRNGKKRPLGIPTMKDRAMQALYLLALEPIAETTSDPNSYGFRKERSTADAIEQCFKVLCGKHSARWILEADIKACFDRISHEWLLANIPMEKAILRKWLKAGYMEQGILYATEEGTPQGGIISPVLANMALDRLEAKLAEWFPKRSRPHQKVHLVRYADDFIITGISKKLLKDEVKPLVEEFLRERGLTLSPEKTRVTHIEDGFDFLGFNIRRYQNKVLTKPAKKSVKAFLAKVRGIIKRNPTFPAGKLIRLLNPIIRGWAQYYRHGVSKRTFCQVDNAIFQTLWRWAKRRHRNKPWRWVKGKYFPAANGREWAFSGKVDGKTYHLFYAARVPIRRHIKVKGRANPFDPEWEIYFEKRLTRKMTHTLKGRRQLRKLWREQNGICPVCEQKITEITEWNNHHIIWRSKGGPDTAENRVLLHPNCHRQVHNLKLTVEKPRPVKRALVEA